MRLTTDCPPAGSAVRYLIETSSIQDEKFSSAGYGEFRPLADNETEEGRAINRRVEFSIELKDENSVVIGEDTLIVQEGEQ